ncbi:MAG: hypothetical protein M1360_04160 [Candidatus Marsarchaeota archaeon]|nr:hypothetical protein [Candidatus Marsarchaeota archaeon]MCL5419102.1 hypothetical protein [Candidatus Marsarchaeota archaeon]
MADDNIIKRLAFRLVKRHIAGFTIESALNSVRILNAKKLHATVTFLNGHVHDRVKAKYNTNAYMQLLRQLSRLHLDAGISLRLSQLGYDVDKGFGERNLAEIIDAAREGAKFVWLEGEQSVPDVPKLYKRLVQKHALLGMEMPLGYKEVRKEYNIKIRYHMHNMRADAKSADAKGLVQEFSRNISSLAERVGSVTVFEKDYHVLSKVINSCQGKRNLIFELPLGYEKNINTDKQARGMSVYVPYGRDWVPYIISSIAEGRVKRVATTLLDGEKNGGGSSNAN